MKKRKNYPKGWGENPMNEEEYGDPLPVISSTSAVDLVFC